MKIQIDNAGLSKISAAGQAVTLVRDTAALIESSVPLQVAWQVFAPLQINEIDWADQYYGFATTARLHIGAVVTMNSRSGAPMPVGSVATFYNGQFTSVAGTGARYAISNATSNGDFCFGLAQIAVVNGTSVLAPVCVMSILTNETAHINPRESISIFLSSCTTAGTIIPSPSNAFRLAIKPGSSATTVGFNNQTNRFFQLS